MSVYMCLCVCVFVCADACACLSVHLCCFRNQRWGTANAENQVPFDENAQQPQVFSLKPGVDQT